MKSLILTLICFLRIVYANEVLGKQFVKHKTGHPGSEPGSPEFWYHLGVSICLVLAGGVFAGRVLSILSSVRF